MSTRPRGSEGGTAYVVAAGFVAVAVVVLVVVFGVERPPTLPTIEEEPDPAPPVGVAWSDWSADEACVHTLTPAGEREEAWCDRDGGELLAWRGDGTFLVARFDGGDRRAVVVDPESGEVRPQEDDAADAGPGGERVWFDTSFVDGVLVVRHEDVELWRVDASDAYRVHDGVISPDGAWIVARDSADRLLLFARDGSSPVREWASSTPGASTVVWRGAEPTD